VPKNHLKGKNYENHSFARFSGCAGIGSLLERFRCMPEA
jgi:hypothetical protein